MRVQTNALLWIVKWDVQKEHKAKGFSIKWIKKQMVWKLDVQSVESAKCKVLKTEEQRAVAKIRDCCIPVLTSGSNSIILSQKVEFYVETGKCNLIFGF